MRRIGLAVLVCWAVITPVQAQGGDDGRTTLDLSGRGWKLWRDKDAAWNKDPLYLRHEASGLFKRDDDPAIANPDQPGSLKLDQLPVNPPTGGWDVLDKAGEAEVSVPGTVEEYLWGKDGNPIDNDGKYFGVSWWWREFTMPAAAAGKRILLQCGATRQRSEIYIDGRLCGYDVVGNTPYEFDVTPFLQGGGTHRIAFRITNPGGSFGWEDNPCLRWGDTKTRINLSHGFAGISGPVRLAIVGPVSIADLWVRNTPAMREVIPTVTVENAGGREVSRDLEVTIREAVGGAVVATARKTVTLPAGRSETAVPVTVADARLWSPETPNLYACRVALRDGGVAADAAEKKFGFRWFDVAGVGTNAQFELNGKRVRLVSAISWGFWPQSGLVATPELAAKQVTMAKRIGLNCLNHHRTIGDPKTLDEADRQGLFYYEEAGGYEGYEADAFAFAMNREKLLRMVKRDRSHPSTIHYNMANEPAPMRNEGQKRDMLDAHKLDPTRTITWGSGGTMGHKGHNPDKLWMKPLDMTPHDYGWRDAHNAGVSDAYIDTLYDGPGKYHGYAGDIRDEVVFWGEEGPIGTPPRLQLLKDQCSRPGHRMGWDGDEWLMRYRLMDQWLKDSRMDRWFTVDSLTQSAGEKQYYYQGRMIENAMIDDSSDGYVVSGWENDKRTSMGGLVDLWRNPKTENLELIRAYIRPLYVAVKPREKVAQPGEAPVVDFWLVNELDIKGTAELQIQVMAPSKKLVAFDRTTMRAACGNRCADEVKWVGEMGPKVKITGGDRFGELLLESVKLPAFEETGYYKIEANLYYRGEVVASGSDLVLVVDWKSAKLPARGAVLETDGKLARFLKSQKGMDVPAYAETLGKLDYVLVGNTAEPLLVAGDTNMVATAVRLAAVAKLDTLVQRAKEDGTTVIFLEPALVGDRRCYNDELLRKMVDKGLIARYDGVLTLGPVWLGGSYYAGAGPLFDGLPERTAFSWEYQLLAQNPQIMPNLRVKRDRPFAEQQNIGLRIPGVEALVGATTDFNLDPNPKQPGTAVGVIPCGKGRLILSTLPITPYLESERGAAHVVRKLLCNMIGLGAGE